MTTEQFINCPANDLSEICRMFSGQLILSLILSLPLHLDMHMYTQRGFTADIKLTSPPRFLFPWIRSIDSYQSENSPFKLSLSLLVASAWKVGVGLCSVLRFTNMGKFEFLALLTSLAEQHRWEWSVNWCLRRYGWVGGGNTVINVLPTGKRRCCCWSLPYHDDPRITLEYWRTISSRTFQEKTPFHFNNSTNSLDHFIIQDFIFQIQIPVFRFSHKSTTITQPSL